MAHIQTCTCRKCTSLLLKCKPSFCASPSLGQINFFISANCPHIKPCTAQIHICCLETLFKAFSESVRLIIKPLNSLCFQCSPALPGGTEEATTESDEEDQHLHRHLHALLRSLCDHKVSAVERLVGVVGVRAQGNHADTLRHSSLFLFCWYPPNCPPVLHPLAPTPTSSVPPLPLGQSWKMRLADLVISNMPLLCW